MTSLEFFSTCRVLAKTQHFAIIKCFWCDLGGEYTFNTFSKLLVETAHSLLLFASTTSEFWWETILIATYLINKILTSHNTSLFPFEKLYRYVQNYSFLYVPNFSFIHAIGFTYFILRPHVYCSKLSSRSIICSFLGYGTGQKGYRCLDPFSQKLYVSHHVIFLEHISFFTISTSFHNMTKSDFIHIDPFSFDTEIVPPLIPRISSPTLDHDSSRDRW